MRVRCEEEVVIPHALFAPIGWGQSQTGQESSSVLSHRAPRIDVYPGDLFFARLSVLRHRWLLATDIGRQMTCPSTYTSGRVYLSRQRHMREQRRRRARLHAVSCGRHRCLQRPVASDRRGVSHRPAEATHHRDCVSGSDSLRSVEVNGACVRPSECDRSYRLPFSVAPLANCWGSEGEVRVRKGLFGAFTGCLSLCGKISVRASRVFRTCSRRLSSRN